MKKLSCLVVLLAVLLAVPALAADRVIYNGIDLWRTPADGSTHADFAKTPIPAGFFCYKSEPFTGRIGFKGVPLATNVPGGIGATDTILQRLDDAVFNKRGVAQTRLQIRALNFEGLAPVKTACGDFTVRLSLDGEQPITRMRIMRENATGGRFLAPIAVNVKISFTPVGRPAAEPLEIRQKLTFPPLPNQHWVTPGPETLSKTRGFLLVDTDGDSAPDTYLPGTSNFLPGRSSLNKAECVPTCHIHPENEACHCVCPLES